MDLVMDEAGLIGGPGGAETCDAVVIGAGVIGLAVARRVAEAGRDVLVLEAERSIGTGTSSRNSEVIHAGIYYPENSLKARLCVRGKEALYRYCDERGVAYRRVGKLLVACAPEEIEVLEALVRRANANGVDDLRWLSEDEARALEPGLACAAAVLSPSTGILDSHALMLAYQGDIDNAGGTVAVGAKVLGGASTPDGVRLSIAQDGRIDLICRSVVNCAGLGAQSVARSITGTPPEAIPELFLARGNYFGLTGRAPFSRLVYPIPSGGGAGIHLTLDLSGRARFGPDVEWLETPNYKVDPARAESFYAEIRRYWPSLPDSALYPDYAGIRAKLHGRGSTWADFQIVSGGPGLINLFGMESPGLTASLAIAEHVAEMLGAAAH